MHQYNLHHHHHHHHHHHLHGSQSGGVMAAAVGAATNNSSAAAAAATQQSRHHHHHNLVHGHHHLEQYISKRNERERSRVRNVNDAFDNLKNSLPLDLDRLTKRMSKVDILRTAISYIRNLEDVLGYAPEPSPGSSSAQLHALAGASSPMAQHQRATPTGSTASSVSGYSASSASSIASASSPVGAGPTVSSLATQCAYEQQTLHQPSSQLQHQQQVFLAELNGSRVSIAVSHRQSGEEISLSLSACSSPQQQHQHQQPAECGPGAGLLAQSPGGGGGGGQCHQQAHSAQMSPSGGVSPASSHCDAGCLRLSANDLNSAASRQLVGRPLSGNANLVYRPAQSPRHQQPMECVDECYGCTESSGSPAMAPQLSELAARTGHNVINQQRSIQSFMLQSHQHQPHHFNHNHNYHNNHNHHNHRLHGHYQQQSPIFQDDSYFGATKCHQQTKDSIRDRSFSFSSFQRQRQCQAYKFASAHCGNC